MTSLAVIDDDVMFCDLIEDIFDDEFESVLKISTFDEEAEQRVLAEKPQVILLDVNMPGKSGYEVCEQLCQAYDEKPQVIFISGLTSEEDKVKAYNVGANDYLSKPVEAAVLRSKVGLAVSNIEKLAQAATQSKMFQDMAFQAMGQNSELGSLLRFFEQSTTIDNLDELASSLFELLVEQGLNASIIFYQDGGYRYISADGVERPLEVSVFEKARGASRLVDFGSRTIVNASNCAILIRNMPIEDEERYGIIKDNICFVITALESRVAAINLQQSLRHKEALLEKHAEFIDKIIADVNDNARTFVKQGTDILSDLMIRMREEFAVMDLTLQDEERIMGGLERDSDTLHTLFADHAEYQKLINRLLEKLSDQAK
jgi:DNA-binding response OmpR family regulator